MTGVHWMPVVLLVLVWLLPTVASAQQPTWKDLALQAQENAARDHFLTNAVIVALQAEIAELRSQLAKSRKDDPEDHPK